MRKTSASALLVAVLAFMSCSKESGLEPAETEGVISAASAPTSRNAGDWPFSADSPWNTPVGSGAQYATPSSPEWTTEALKYGLLINCKDWTIPIYFAKSSDPMRKFYRTNGGSTGFVTFEKRVPDNAAPDPGGDKHLAIIDPSRTKVVEMWKGNRRSDMDIEAPFPNEIDLKGPGVFDTYKGSCAYGGSSLGGLIRTGELTNGIRHALRISITPKVLNKNAPGGKPYVWPANSSDDPTSYTGTGNIHMGSLLAIPPDVDISTRAQPGTAFYELLKAMQDYGCYVVDRGHFNIYAEPGATTEVDKISWNDKQKVGALLKVVTNNRADNVGGGGTRRRPLAPPFSN